MANRVRFKHALLIAFLLIVISVPMGTNVPRLVADGGTILTVAEVSGPAGQQVQVPVSVDTGGVVISGLQVNLAYDGALLTIPVASAGSVLPESWTFQAFSPASGDTRFLAIDPAGDGLALKGEVFMMEFTISAEAIEGNVPVIVARVDMLDSTGAVMAVTANSGLVTVTLNQLPVVDAGEDITINFASPATGSLIGTATDDGLPNPPADIEFAWSLVSGPGTATFSDSAALDSQVTVSESGSYVIRLTVDDGQFTVSDDLTFAAVRQYGNASLSGTFGIPDVLLLIDWLLGKADEPLPTSEAFLATDVDADASLTLSDVILMIHKLVGKIDQFPVEANAV